MLNLRYCMAKYNGVKQVTTTSIFYYSVVVRDDHYRGSKESLNSIYIAQSL